MLQHLALHVLIEKSPSWILWILMSLLGGTTAAMWLTPDLVPLVDEAVMSWLTASVVLELRRRGQIEDTETVAQIATN